MINPRHLEGAEGFFVSMLVGKMELERFTARAP
jgi:hypothetical protein